MKKLIIAAAMLGTAIAAPATAQSYSLAGDFGNPVFQYGTVNGGTVTPFTASDCSDIGVSGLCYRGSDTYQVEFQRTANQLVVHPGPGDGQNSFLLFTAPTAGTYAYDVTVQRGDSGDGVNLFTFNSADTSQPQIGRIDAASPTYTLKYRQFLQAGQQVGLGVDRGGANSTYFNDSTFFSGTISAVPEPASWALMIMGFGVVGGAMRRRAKVATTVRFA